MSLTMMLCLHDAQRAPSQDQPLEVEAAEEDVDALVDLPEHVLSRDLAVVKHELARSAPPDTQLVQLRTRGESLKIHIITVFSAVLELKNDYLISKL